MSDDGTLHSEVGASGAHRWMLCPGSVTLSRGLPNPSSEFAEEGTRAHELGEAILSGLELIDIVNRTPEDQEMIDYVSEYTNFVLEELNRCQVKQTEKIVLHVEAEVNLHDIDERMFGTQDAMFYCAAEGTLYVFDLKYGKGIEVDVEDNPQLMYYALASWTTCFASKVVLTIVQPRTDGQSIKRVTYSYADMMRFSRELEVAINRVDAEPETYVPGPKQCKWCIASAVCPALSKTFSDTTQLQPQNPLVESDTPTVVDMTPERLGTIYANIPMLKKWLEDVDTHCVELSKAGVTIPGTKLVQQRKHRVFKNPKAAKNALLKAGYREKDIEASKLITPAQLEKLGVPKKEVAKLTITPVGKPVLARENDKRPALDIGSLGFKNEES